MNDLVKLARVIADDEAQAAGYADRHHMYQHLDRLPSDGSGSLSSRLFSDPSSGAVSGALTGAAGFVGLGSIPGILGKISERDVRLELAAREKDESKAREMRKNTDGVGLSVAKGLVGGTLLGPLGGAIKGYELGGLQQKLSDIIRTNRNA